MSLEMSRPIIARDIRRKSCAFGADAIGTQNIFRGEGRNVQVLEKQYTYSIVQQLMGMTKLRRAAYYSLECAYVASSLDFTYSPAVTTSYFAGLSSETQLGRGSSLTS